MNKNFLKSLLFGAFITASAGTFVSCNYDDDIDELNSRVTVVEGLIGELKTALGNGAMVTSATQDEDGTWTLNLSNGQSIVIKPGSTGGSSETIEVTDNPDNVIIKVGDKEFVLPKGAAAASLLYRAQYEDGFEQIDNMSPIEVQFQISGAAIDQATLDKAKIQVVDAYLLQTRAAEDLFTTAAGAKVETKDGVNVVIVPIKANQGVQAGNSYNVNIRITSGSKEYVSNYFKIKIGSNFVFNNTAYDDNIKVKGGTFDTDNHLWTAPDLTTMEGDVDFSQFFENLPAGAKFAIGSQVTDEGKAAVDALRNSLNSDGKFSWTQRPGTAFPNGFRVVIVNASDQILAQADFKYADPLANVDFVGVYAEGKGGHIEIRGGDTENCPFVKEGPWEIDLAKDFTKAGEEEGYYSPMHDGGRFIKNQWSSYKATLNDPGDIIDFDGTRYVLGTVGNKFAQASKGIWWTSHQLSLGASNRRNDPARPADEGSDDNIAWCGSNCNGELIWDGLPGDARVTFGIDLKENGRLVATSNYKGWNMRVGIWIKYEYLYGEKEIGGGALIWTWLNRRTCPIGLSDQPIVDAKAQNE